MNKTVSSAEQLLYGMSLDDKMKAAIIQPSVLPSSSQAPTVPKSGTPLNAQSNQLIADSDLLHESFINYLQFYKIVDAFEKYYVDAGVVKGDRVLMTGPNSAALVASIFACWRLGVLAIPVDFRMTAQELANVALKVQVKLLLVSERFQERTKLLEALGENKKVLHVLEELERGAGGNEPAPLRQTAQDDNFPALMILTSGTTGTPKGAVHDFRSLLENFHELGEMAGLNSQTVALLPLPVSHIFGLEVVSVCIIYGGSIIFCELEPSRFVAAINKHRPDIISGVPLMYGSLLSASIPADAVDLSRSRILLSGGAPLPIPLAKDFQAKFAKRINNGYGSTESKIIALNLDGPVESIGRPITSVKVHIVNANGEDLSEGNEGELVIESPHLMQGYYGQPEKTAEVLDGQRYKTGDIGYVKDGYLYISGRAKEMIVVAGNKVFPSEVEEVLLRNPLVAEVAVTGPEHRRLGQIVKATVVVKDLDLSKKLEAGVNTPGNLQAKEARDEILKNLKQFCQENLKRELRPMEWDLRPLSQPLPKTRSGKIDKKELG